MIPCSYTIPLLMLKKVPNKGCLKNLSGHKVDISIYEFLKISPTFRSIQSCVKTEDNRGSV